MKKTALILVLAFISASCFSQKYGKAAAKKQRDLSITFYSYGISAGGPSKEIEKAMISAKFDCGYSWGGLFSPTNYKHPYSDTGPNVITMGIHYAFKPPFSAGFFMSFIPGKTSGFHEKAGDLDIAYQTIMLSPILSITFTDFIRIGMGPAIYETKAWKCSDNDKTDEKSKTIKPGLLLDMALIFPKYSLFFFELNYQYRIVGKADIGPFTADKDANSATLPAIRVNYNHWFIGASTGIRFNINKK